jgi:hypothetical protein
VDKVNVEYGGWDIRPSNVFFSGILPHPSPTSGNLKFCARTNSLGGEFDPWRTLSLLSDEPWAPKDVQLMQEIPDQGTAPPQGKVFGYLLKGAAHCYDFRTSWPDGAASRALFMGALRKWLAGYPKRETI